MHIVKYNRRGDGHVMSPPLRTTGRDAYRYFLKGTLSVHTLYMLLSTEVGLHTLCENHGVLTAQVVPS